MDEKKKIPEDLCRSVLELDEIATPEPWCQHPNGSSVWSGGGYGTSAVADNVHLFNVALERVSVDPARVCADTELVATYRSAAPELAQFLLAAIGVLERLEWSAHDGAGYSTCPVCHGRWTGYEGSLSNIGHREGCALGRLIGQTRRSEP